MELVAEHGSGVVCPVDEGEDGRQFRHQGRMMLPDDVVCLHIDVG